MFPNLTRALTNLREVLRSAEFYAFERSLWRSGGSRARGGSTPARSRVVSIGEWADTLKKSVVSCAALVALAVVVTALAREVWQGTIVIEPIHGPNLLKQEGFDPQAAAEKVGFHLRSLQQRSAEERRRLVVDDQPLVFDFQIPGSTISFAATVRYVASLIAKPRDAPQAEITGGKDGYKATVRMSGLRPKQDECGVRGHEELDQLYVCIARIYLRFLDPMAAAMDRFHDERSGCVKPPRLSATRRVHPRADGPFIWRQMCSFVQTRRLIAEALGSGDGSDATWVFLVYGKIHIARAEAVRAFSYDMQISELKQAVGLFQQALSTDKGSVTVLTSLAGAHLDEAVSVHESVPSLSRSTQAREIDARLDQAAGSLNEAMAWIAKARQASRPSRQLVARTAKLETLTLYRLWMVNKHRKTRRAEIQLDCEEREHLPKAVEAAELAIRLGEADYSLYMTKGNAERALCRFEGAVVSYRRASELAPTLPAPILNIAIAYLDAARHPPNKAETGVLFKALGSVADHLLWASDGGPYDIVPDKIREVLTDHGRDDLRRMFAGCYDRDAFAGDPYRSRMHVVLLKACVEAVIVELARAR